MSGSSTAQRPPNIPGYELLEKIGEGGMGEVYRARQLRLQRIVAIKFLHGGMQGQKLVSAFQRESHLMAALVHPNVVMIHDSGEIDGRPYLVMEYVAGSTLRSLLLPGQPWPIAEAAPLLDAIAQALCSIHAQGILHLDLKPENVLCDPVGAIKITDFGLALPHRDAGMLVEKGLSQGTVDYCAPEQRFGLPVDARSDLFSLAVLAYELLTGRLPGRVFVPATERNPRLPAALNEVLRLGLARDPEERMASVEEFRSQLADVLRAAPTRWDDRVAWFGLILVMCLLGVYWWKGR